MSINSSDLSKQALGSLQFRQDQRVANDFRAQKQAESKVVQTMADTNQAAQENARKHFATSPSRDVKTDDIMEMNNKMSQLNVHLSFEMSEDGDENIVKVLDQATGDVVRQIPSEEFIKMSKRIDDIMGQLSEIKGSLVNSQA